MIDSAPFATPLARAFAGCLARRDAQGPLGPLFPPQVFQLLNDPDAAAPGDFKFDPLGLGGSMDLQEKELANGRLAMMAFSGIVTQAAITEGPFPYIN